MVNFGLSFNEFTILFVFYFQEYLISLAKKLFLTQSQVDFYSQIIFEDKVL